VGYWGNATASVDWCEQNYQHSPYIAETFNSFTNIFYTIIALYGFLKLRASSNNPPIPLQIVYFLVFVVSFGSFTFHATLTKIGQLMDELPMLYAVLLMLYFILFLKNKPSMWKIPVGIVLTFLGISMTYYMVWINPNHPQLFFDSWYALCQTTVLIEIYWNTQVKTTKVPLKFFTFFQFVLFHLGTALWVNFSIISHILV
jgi:dihydroceramidase